MREQQTNSLNNTKKTTTTAKKKLAQKPNFFKALFATKANKKGKSTKKQPAKKKNRTGEKITFFMLVLAFSAYAFVASVSHIFTWETETNLCGRWGYQIASIIVGQWFGVWGFLLPFLLIFLVIYLMNRKLIVMRKTAISMLFALAIFPLITAFISSDNTFCGVGLGGNYGAGLLNASRGTIGNGGLIILSIVLFALWVLYTIPKSGKFFARQSKELAEKILIKKESQEDIEDQESSDNPFFEEEVATSNINRTSQNDEIEEEESVENNSEEQEVKRGFFSFKKKAKPQVIIEKETIEEKNEEIISLLDEPDNIALFEDNSNDTSTYKSGMYELPEEKSDDTPLFEADPYIEPRDTTKNSSNDLGFEISFTSNAVVVDGEGHNIKVNAPEQLSDDEIVQDVYDPTKELSHYKLPPLSLLNDRIVKVNVSAEEEAENTQRIIKTFADFGIGIEIKGVTAGPTVTLYEIIPQAGVRISKIKGLEDNIALSLSALGIRIIAPIPGKGTVGIEVPNKNTEIVSMHSVIKSRIYQETTAELPIVLGRTIQNQDYVFDLAKAPHLLVAGATGQGKSVGLNAIIASLLYKKHPAELKFVLIDPKKVELALYKNIENHYLAKLPDAEEAIITDTDKVIHTLNALCVEMYDRYDLLKAAKVVRIKDYNEKFKNRRLNPNKGHRYMPYFVVIIDEFADLIMSAGKEIETPIARIAQLARAVGIHLVIATQRPTVNIITGVIKANFPMRIAFRVTSSIDSKTILDQVGANQLIGMGDMLILNNIGLTRVQCAFIDTPELEKITEYIGSQQGYPSPYELPEYTPDAPSSKDSNTNGGYGESITQRRDGMFDEIARYVVTNQQGSASTIQRNFAIGFNRAGRIMDQMEKAGIVGKQQGSKPRVVLISDLTSLEILMIDLDRR